MEHELKTGADESTIHYLVSTVSHLTSWPKRELSRCCPSASSAIVGRSRREPDKSKEPWPGILAALAAKGVAALSGAPLVVAPSGPGVVAAEDLALLGGAPQPSKTGTFDDTIVLDDKIIGPCIRDVYITTLRGARDGHFEYLFRGLNCRLYYDYVGAVGKKLGLPSARAASEDFFRQLRDLGAIQQRGRWRSPASVQRYQKAGRLLTALRRCGDDVSKRAEDVDAEHLSFSLWVFALA